MPGMKGGGAIAADAPSPGTRVWAEISGEALRANARALKARAGAGLMAVVKADAYGHGLAETVAALAPETDLFAVANLDEAEVVRAAAPGTPVLLLSPCLPAERGDAVARGFIPTVSSAAEAAAFCEAGRGAQVAMHYKVDTGMGRAGEWHESAVETLREIVADPRACIHSISTHLARADEDAAFTAEQLGRFERALGGLRELAPAAKIHALNSAGSWLHPGKAGDFVRAGLAVYGIAPVPEMRDALHPALAWRSRVLLARGVPAGRTLSYGSEFTTAGPTRVATVAVGYADGFSRRLAGRARVLVRGAECPVLGRVTMDQILVDATGAPGCEPGDVVTLIGEDGGRSISANDLAGWAGTIPWEILTGIGGRTRRIYR